MRWWRASLLASPTVVPASTVPWRWIAPVRARIASSSVVLPLWNGPTSAMHRGPEALVPFCAISASLAHPRRGLLGTMGPDNYRFRQQGGLARAAEPVLGRAIMAHPFGGRLDPAIATRPQLRFARGSRMEELGNAVVVSPGFSARRFRAVFPRRSRARLRPRPRPRRCGSIPPFAARKPVRLTTHGIERVDDYAWLRDPSWRDVMQDPSRLAPAIRAHLDAENSYAEAALAPLSGLRVKLVEEMKGADRAERVRSSARPTEPTPIGRKYLPGAEHPHIVRAPTGGGPEEVLLDGPALAAGKVLFLVRRRPSQPGPSLLRLHGRRDRLRELHAAHPRSPQRTRPARGHSRGIELHLGAATAARCSMWRTTTIIAPASSTGTAWDRPRQGSARLRREGSRVRGLGRHHAEPPLRRDRDRQRRHLRGAADRRRAARAQAGAGRPATAGAALLRDRLGRPARHPHQCGRRRRLQDRHRARVGAGPQELARSGAVPGRPAHHRRDRVRRSSRPT